MTCSLSTSSPEDLQMHVAALGSSTRVDHPSTTVTTSSTPSPRHGARVCATDRPRSRRRAGLRRGPRPSPAPGPRPDLDHEPSFGRPILLDRPRSAPTCAPGRRDGHRALPASRTIRISASGAGRDTGVVDRARRSGAARGRRGDLDPVLRPRMALRARRSASSIGLGRANTSTDGEPSRAAGHSSSPRLAPRRLSAAVSCTSRYGLGGVHCFRVSSRLALDLATSRVAGPATSWLARRRAAAEVGFLAP